MRTVSQKKFAFTDWRTTSEERMVQEKGSGGPAIPEQLWKRHDEASLGQGLQEVAES